MADRTGAGRTHPGEDELRRIAEDVLRRREADAGPVLDQEHLTLAKAIHELRLHEIELAMQHQALSRAHADLQANAGLNRALFTACPGALILTDDRGTVLDINEAALRLVQRRLPTGPTLVDGFFATDDRPVPVRQRREAVAAGGESPLATARLASGRQVEMATRVLHEAHRGRMYLHALTDITERERQLQEIDRARMAAQEGEQAKRVLLAMASHELRTPLQAISTAMEILSAVARDDAERELVAIGQQSLATLLQEIDGLLDTARLEQGGIPLTTEPFHPAEVAAAAIETVALARERRTARICYELSPELLPMVGDATRLRQVVISLLDNACSYTKPGTAVQVRVRPLPAEGDRSAIRIEIQDDGPGLDEQVRRHLFTPFVRGRVVSAIPGIGLGLSLAKGLVTRMGGRIGHLDAPSGGSLFWVELDLPKATGFVSNLPPLRLHTWTQALWIDEDEAHATAACTALTAAGCPARAVPSVAVAVTRLAAETGRAVVFVSPRRTAQAATVDMANLRTAGHMLIEILSPLEPSGSVGHCLGSVLRPATPGRLAIALDRAAQSTGQSTPDLRPAIADVGWAETQSLIDAMPEHVAVLDRFGVIRAVNRRWREFATANGATDPHAFLKTNYLEVCWNACQDRDGAAKPVNDRLREVLTGRRETFSFEYPCHSPQEQRWFILYAATLYSRTGEPRGAVVTHLNITNRRQQEQDQERLIGELRHQLADLMGR